MAYSADYYDLPERTLIPMADGTTKTISTVFIGDLVRDKNENICRVADILTGLNEVEKLNYMNKIEKCKVPLYTLLLEKQ
ncbi:hypothetical protein DSECCO2_273650 [anaerobic digester metagenome]